MNRKTIKIRQKILAGFSAVLFVSFLLVGIIFNLAMRFNMPEEGYYAIAYVANFSGRAGLILITTVGVMFVVAVIVTYFLSNSITRPIEKLSEFAANIGPGNFIPNNFEFNEKELHDLNTALNKSVKQLEAYDSEQKIFFQNASHELRTPLMSIKCYAEGISFGLMSPKEASDTILQETDRLAELVEDLLYISKISAITTPYITKQADILAIVRDCIERQQVQADKRRLAITLSCADEAINHPCIKELLSRAVDNLISNAIRYAKSYIEVTCVMQGGRVFITVADDGNGIDAELLPYIFERFYKGDKGNHGIGMSIVKSIIDLHGGSIEAKNANGAVFEIII